MISSRSSALVGALLTVATLVASCSSDPAPATTEPAGSAASAAAPRSSSAAPVAPPAPMSESDQVREAVMAVQDAYNTQNWAVYQEMMCPEQRAKFTGPVMDQAKSGRQQTGLTTVKVLDVTIDGDVAKASLEATNEIMGTKNISMRMERSDGWKLCVRDLNDVE